MAQTIEITFKFRVDDTRIIKTKIGQTSGENDEAVDAIDEKGIAHVLGQMTLALFTDSEWIQAVGVLKAEKTGNVPDSIF